MVIRLDENYNAMTSTALLGYVGETNARPVSVEGLTVDGADRYVLTIDYGDGTVYEVDITGGQWTPTADILRSSQTVSCQIAAKKLSGDEYVLVKKSRIFRLRIGAAIGDTAIPSPDVAMDALDRIDAIGRQVHADMQTAVTAAETATTAAENAEKSATDAEKSADTAEQAASRAETAKTAAETSAAQSETARQGAENARQQAVTSQNNAKISAAQAATSAQQTEADKTITTGYAKTAKTCADSTTADRQAVQEMAEQVTVDKATVADHAAQVAEDRTAAETAAQTAQAVADSLPDDYVTAVGKIAENTAEIGRVKLTDKELTRRVNALYSIGNGITHQFETDSETAYVKTIPTGAKLMSVKSVGGRSIVWNQLCDTVLDNFSDTVSAVYHEYGICKFTANVGDKICIYSGGINGTYAANGAYVAGFIGSAYIEFFGKQIVQCTENGNCIIYLRLRGGGNTYSNVSVRPEFFNLTKMFGSGNEPNTVEEFEKIFPADYYPYNAGEIVSAGVTEVAVGETAHLIPEAIKALPGYGWSAGTAKNYVDYENKKYVQCVGSVDLGTVQWVAGDGERVSFQTSQVKGQKLTKNYTILPNFLCSKYLTKTQNEVWGKTDVTGISADANADGYVYINDMSYTDVDAFKQAMSGVILYYELAEPIVTDISSLIPDDFLRNIEVEAGGSITFKGGNDNYRIPVPSEEEYVVKLSEVGGAT
jgi:hypothetical protein|nr:MAG TPA: hypothetical protein [Caudoviricetes sp.]